MKPSAFNVLGIPISAVTLREAVDHLETLIEEDQREHVCVCTVNNVMDARSNAIHRHALREASMNTPDGWPLMKLGQRRVHERVGRVRGTDLMLEFHRRAAEEGYRSFLYGGGPDVAEQTAEELEARFGGLEIAGTETPPRLEVDERDQPGKIARINEADPDIVWVGLGCPKQEVWMLNHRSDLEAPVLVGVGAAFDFIAGTKDEAPRWISENGFEWLYRFKQEPRRLWQRVLVQGPKFAGLVAVESIQKTLDS